jgi:hypothetical protein
MNAEMIELVKDLEKFPHLAERIKIMLSVAKNSSGEYELADDVEMKICEEISKMGRELMETWGARQEAVKSLAAQINEPTIVQHSKKNFIGTPDLEK